MAIRAERGAAGNTLDAYARDLADFTGWLDGKAISVLSVDRAMIEAYLVALNDRGLSASTRARRLSAIRQFYRFAFSEGWRADDPGAGIAGPRRTRALPDTLSEAETGRLLAVAAKPGRNPARAARLKCLIELLYATGLRVSELVSLPAAPMRGDPEMVLVRGKGGHERMVPLSGPARAATADWLVLRDGAEAETIAVGARPSPYLFPSRGKSGHLTRVAFYRAIKDLAARAGISPERVTPHAIRHGFATHLLANGADLRTIQILLGHADISTTEIYTHILDERLKTLVLENHPLVAG